MTERLACVASDVPAGTALRVDLPLFDGTEAPVAVVQTTDGRFCALDDTCSHGAFSLSEGEVIGHEIECSGHGARFDLVTGQPTALPAVVPVHAYPVRIEGGNVLVDVDTPVTATKEDA
jgi:3-phenylpropionate/trans-cinnamate dioxygenase ferredoxin subunit